MFESQVMKNTKNLIMNSPKDIPEQQIFTALSNDVIAGLNVDMVSIWYFDETCEKLSCQYSLDRSNNNNLIGINLLKTDYPAYFNALIQGVSIRADDVFTNPNTAELIESYFKPYQVKSLLDYIIYKGETPVGLICCETTREKRIWTGDDIDYVRALTVMAGVELKSAKKN